VVVAVVVRIRQRPAVCAVLAVMAAPAVVVAALVRDHRKVNQPQEMVALAAVAVVQHTQVRQASKV
jgi:hypothetical protein